MKFALLIHDVGQQWGALPSEELAARMEEYEKYTTGLVERGLMHGGEQLQPTLAAKTVRQKDGKVLKADGPFATTKEQLGGFYVIESEDLDGALEAASEIPSVNYGGVVEVRPIAE